MTPSPSPSLQFNAWRRKDTVLQRKESACWAHKALGSLQPQMRFLKCRLMAYFSGIYSHSGWCCLCLRVGARTRAVSEGWVCVHPWRVSYIIFSTKNIPWSACKMLSTLWANPVSLWEKATWFRVVTQKWGSGLREGRTCSQAPLN